MSAIRTVLIALFLFTGTGTASAEGGRLLLKGAAMIVTMDPALGRGELGIIENGDLLISGDRIVEVGKVTAAGPVEEIDVSGKIVLPGFVDVHNHLWQALIRGCGTDKDVIDWFLTCQLPLYDASVPAEVVHAGVRLSTLDLINTGVTTTVDWAPGPSPEFVRGNLRALEDSGLRFVFAYFGTSIEEATIENMKATKARLDANPLGTFQVGAHPAAREPYRANFLALAKLAKTLDVKLHVHLREHVGDKRIGQLQLLADSESINDRLHAAHNVHLTDAEIALLAERGVRIAHSPLSNMRTASGIMRLPVMMDAGLRIGLGLDGGCNDTSDMFNTMRIAIGLQRALALRPDVRPTVSEALSMATMGGARMLDMEDRIGSLTPGKQADFIVLDPATTNFAPRFDWLDQIVFNAQPANVESVFVNGRALKRDGEWVGVDVKEVISRAETSVAVIKAILEEAGGTRKAN